VGRHGSEAQAGPGAPASGMAQAIRYPGLAGARDGEGSHRVLSWSTPHPSIGHPSRSPAGSAGRRFRGAKAGTKEGTKAGTKAGTTEPTVPKAPLGEPGAADGEDSEGLPSLGCEDGPGGALRGETRRAGRRALAHEPTREVPRDARAGAWRRSACSLGGISRGLVSEAAVGAGWLALAFPGRWPTTPTFCTDL
jgi:hypothetical protein